MGELTALQHVAPADRERIFPLVEVEWDEATPDSAPGKVPTQLASAWGSNPLVLDASAADELDGGVDGVTDLLGRLRGEGISAIPAAGLSSSAEFLDAAANASEHGLCLRLTAEDLGTGPGLASAIDEILTAAGADAHDVDLVIDFGPVDEASLSLHSALLALAFPNIPHIESWRHIVVLSGAFPPSLAIETKQIVPIARADAALWRQAAATGGARRTLDFGDYGVTHPRMVAAGSYRSAPNVRYAHGDDWKAMKWTLRAEEGHSGMYSVARIMRDRGVFDEPEFSWGDAELHSRADGHGGPGNGTQWKAWSTSHHIAKVSSRLSTLGEP
jgi:hypothetical protein